MISFSVANIFLLAITDLLIVFYCQKIFRGQMNRHLIVEPIKTNGVASAANEARRYA